MNSTVIKALMFVAFMVLSLLPVVAQDRGPEAPNQTDLEVPEMILRVQELYLVEVDAVLPEGGELALGQIDVPLPAAGDLEIDQSAFVVQNPIDLAGGALSPSVFTSGQLGAGSANYILGELELYRLGVDPAFRLRFRHESLDGYDFSAPGSGFFSYQNTIDGDVEGGDPSRLSYRVEGGFSESVDGLQGLSDFYSVGVRDTRVLGSFGLLPDPLVRIDADLGAGLTTRIQSEAGSTAVPTEREVTIEPAVTGTLSVSSVDIVVEAAYDGRILVENEIPAEHVIAGSAGVDVAIRDISEVSARAGVSWEPGSQLLYPWSVNVSATLESVDARLGGGYRVDPIRLADLWANMPLATAGTQGASPDLATNPTWYADGSAIWYVGPNLSIGADLAFAAASQSVRIGAFDAALDQFVLTQAPATSVTAAADVGWQATDVLAVEAAWTGTFIDVLPGEPTTAVSTRLQFVDPSERLAATLSAGVGFYPEFLMPEIDFVTTYSPTNELQFVLEANDVLAPLLDSGRPAFGPEVTAEYPFIAPGFTASISARISL